MHKKVFLLSLISILIASCCCGPSRVSFQALESAEISLPQNVQKILVINRYRPTKHNNWGNIIEGMLTGEKPMQDRRGAEAALSGMEAQLLQSPRFSIVHANEELFGTGTAWFPEPLSSDVILDLCKRYNTDAVVCLEAFDSDKQFQLTPQYHPAVESSKTAAYTSYIAKRSAQITVCWRLYEGKTANLLDEHRMSNQDKWTREDRVQQNAINGLPNEVTVMENLGRVSGAKYANRIAPNWVTISRKIYTKGDESFKTGKRYMETKKYDDAIAIYKTALQNPKSKIQGKAAYNIAVAFECKSDLKEAKSWASKAYNDYGFKDGLSYTHTIDARIEDQERVEKQMKSKEK